MHINSRGTCRRVTLPSENAWASDVLNRRGHGAASGPGDVVFFRAQGIGGVPNALGAVTDDNCLLRGAGSAKAEPEQCGGDFASRFD